ncbi:MAG: hypothetical protein MHM6MM_003252 [Cercozoa sp. M6MM]
MSSIQSQQRAAATKVPVRGVARAVFFDVPTATELHVPISTAAPLEDPLVEMLREAELLRKKEAATDLYVSKNQGTQTLYRESETQTDPFSANVIIHGDAVNQKLPPLLQMAKFSFENGDLPAGEDELNRIEECLTIVEQIEEAEQRGDLELKRRLLERQEVNEFRAKKRMLEKRDNEQLFKTKRRLRQQMLEREQELLLRVERRRQRLRRDRFEGQRAQCNKQRAVVRTQKRQSEAIAQLVTTAVHDTHVSDELVDVGSSRFVPRRVSGTVPRRNEQWHSESLSTADGLRELHNRIERQRERSKLRKESEQKQARPLTVAQREQKRMNAALGVLGRQLSRKVQQDIKAEDEEFNEARAQNSSNSAASSQLTPADTGWQHVPPTIAEEEKTA